MHENKSKKSEETVWIVNHGWNLWTSKPERMAAMSKNDTQHPTQTTKTGSPPSKNVFFPLVFLQKMAKIAPIRTKKKCLFQLCEATNTVARSVQHGLGELRW